MNAGRLVTYACVLLLMPLSATGEDRKAQTVDELAKTYDVSSCKPCHKQIYEEWEKSLHSRSIIGTRRTSDSFRNMVQNYLLGGRWKYAGVQKIEDLKTEHVIQCLECHLPQIKDAADAVARELAQAAVNGDMETLGKLNINCLVCHNKKAIIHRWVDGPPEKDVVYGNMEGVHADAPAYKTLKKSPIMKETIFCGQCHGLGPGFHHPNPAQCATLYGSYMHAYLPAGGSKTCQDCHMDKGHLMSSYRDPDRAKKAIRVEVETFGYYFHPKAFNWIPTAVVNVKLTSNAGHRIPDGWPTTNRLVLDVTAKTKDGQEIFRESKIYMPQSPIYGRGDFMWSGGGFPGWKSGMVRDTSVQPGQTRSENFEIKFPFEDVEKDGKKTRSVKADEMDVTVQLWYMPAGGDPKEGVPGWTQFLFFETQKSVKLKPKDAYIQ